MHQFEGMTPYLNERINKMIEKLKQQHESGLITDAEKQHFYLIYLQKLGLQSSEVFEVYTNTCWEEHLAMNCTGCNNRPMTHVNYKGTRIYVCETCDHITFEYCNPDDLENLKEYAGGLD